MVVVEWLTRTWPQWTMHHRIASWSLGVEVPNVIEKGKWMPSLRNHATMKNHISLSVNLYWIKMWSDLEIKCGNWLYGVKFSKSQPQKSQRKARSNVATLMKSKKMKWQESTLCKLKIEEKYFIFYLEYKIAALLRGTPHRMPAKSQSST
jgi:hypothetical protein